MPRIAVILTIKGCQGTNYQLYCHCQHPPCFRQLEENRESLLVSRFKAPLPRTQPSHSEPDPQCLFRGIQTFHHCLVH